MTAEAMTRMVTATAPGRLCLAGESLDWMTGGSSAVTAVPLRTRVTAWQLTGSDTLALVSGSPVHRTRMVPDQQAAERRYDGHVLDLLQAAAWVTLGEAGPLGGTVLTAATDLPVSAGLSSSAALTLAAVAALGGLSGTALDVDTVCGLARQAEAGELRSGAGWMDFLACAHGGVNRIEATDPPSLRRLAPALGIPVIVIDTRQRRTTKTVLASKRERFRAGEPDMLVYVQQAPVLVDALTGALSASTVDFREVGRLVNAYHGLLRDRVRCSTELIDLCAQRALSAGAVGAKLSGSGHGGCLFALVPDDAVAGVLQAVADLPVNALALPAGEPDGLAVEAPASRLVAT
jgi:galactokinase